MNGYMEEKFEEYCTKHKIAGEGKKELGKRLEELLEKAKVEPGEALGIVATQSLSEPATQMTMRAYHFAASAGIRMASGLPRLIELFDLRKDIDHVTTIYLEENTKEAAEKVATEIVESVLGDVLLDINYDISASLVYVDLDKSALDRLFLTNESIINTVKKFVKKYPSEMEKQKIYFKNVKTYSEFRALKEKLIEMSIKGIKGAKETIILNKGGEWIIQVRGGSFKKIISFDGVNTKNTTTTNIDGIRSVFGIEAAREALIYEIKRTLEEQGVTVDVRYIGLAADIMCVNGVLEAMSRYGIMKNKKSVLARLNYEETVKVLFNSAISNKKDNLNTLMANLMMNQLCPVGTGTVKLKWKI